MKTPTAFLLGSIFLAFGTSCSHTDQDRARGQAEQAKQEARKLGVAAKSEVKTLDAKIDQALQGARPGSSGNGSQAEQKLDRAGLELKTAGSRAALKLDQAATIAQVKAKLATDVGLSTVASVNVEAHGSVVILTGKVSSDELKHRVDTSAGAVSGVTKVINHLVIQP